MSGPELWDKITDIAIGYHPWMNAVPRWSEPVVFGGMVASFLVICLLKFLEWNWPGRQRKRINRLLAQQPKCQDENDWDYQQWQLENIRLEPPPDYSRSQKWFLVVLVILLAVTIYLDCVVLPQQPLSIDISQLYDFWPA